MGKIQTDPLNPISTRTEDLTNLASPWKIAWPKSFIFFENIVFNKTQAKNIMKKRVSEPFSLDFCKISNPGALYFMSKEDRVILTNNNIRPIQGESTLVRRARFEKAYSKIC